MSRAEEISRDVSRRQADIAPDSAVRRFLVRQSRQEAVHAAAFNAALRLARHRTSCPDRLSIALARFEKHLHADLDAGCLERSMVGLQGVLEAIGAVALRAPGSELSTTGAHFVPLRHVLLKQEEAHHRYGRRWLARRAAEGGRDDVLRHARLEYADLGEAVLVASVDIFEGFATDQQAYLAAGRAAIRAEFETANALPSADR